jgi:hypothetical protein
MIKKAENAAVYRVCVASDARWQVLCGCSVEPLATFNDKHAALAYAMSLARTRASWQLPIDWRNKVLGSMLTRPQYPPGAPRPNAPVCIPTISIPTAAG